MFTTNKLINTSIISYSYLCVSGKKSWELFWAYFKGIVCVCASHLVVSDSLQPHGP